MAARELLGMLLVALSGIGIGMLLLLSKVFHMMHVPSHFALVCGNVMLALFLFIGAYFSGADVAGLTFHQWKWICLRATFGCGAFLFSLVAVFVGGTLGDVNALTCVSVVVATLLGRVFLGERVGFLHILAMTLASFGTVLVSKPDLFLSSQQGQSSNLAGCLLALMSGVSAGGAFIASRKAQTISPFLMTAAVAFLEAVVIIILLLVGILEEPSPIEFVASQPFIFLGAVVSFAASYFIGSVCICMGSQMCPAAASSTIFTSVGMFLGYAAQIVIFEEQPQVPTVIGAFLMLLAVVVVAVARRGLSSEPTKTEVASDGAAVDNVSIEAIDDADENESFASFVAAEFAGVVASSPTAKTDCVRKRRGVTTATATATIVGVAHA